MEDARDYAIKNKMPLKEVSSKNGEGVEETLNMLIEKIIEVKEKE